MKYVIYTILLVVLGSTLTITQEEEVFNLTHDDWERTYIVHFPEDYDESEPIPLVLALHPSGSSGDIFMLTSEFNDQADISDHLIVYPSAIGNYWQYWPEEGRPDDVDFLDTLLDHLIETYNIDESHIYIVGYSSGARMTLRLRCELSDRITAVSVIAASMSFFIAENCLDASPVPTMIIWGTEDTAFPRDGYVRLDNGQLLTSFSWTQNTQFLVAINQCDFSSNEINIISVEDSPIGVVRQVIPDCAGDAEVRIYALMEFDHSWPRAAEIVLADGTVGRLNDEIWDFFNNHSLGE